MEITQPRNVMYPPTRIPFGTYVELSAGQSTDVFELTSYKGKMAHFDVLGVQDLSGVFVEAEYVDEKGLGTSEYNTYTLGGISYPEELDLVSTERFKLSVSNRSSTNYTASGSGAIKLWGTVTVEDPTVVEKMIYGIPLGSEDESLMKQFDLDKKDRYGMLPTKPVEAEATVSDKEVLEENLVTGSDLADDKTVMDESAGGDILILTALSVEGAVGTVSDGIQFEIIQDGDTLTTMDNYGMPSLASEVPCFIPALDELRVRLTGSGNNTVRYKFRYVKVPETIVEKAMWLPIEEVAPSKRDAYKIIRKQLNAGVEIGVKFETKAKRK